MATSSIAASPLGFRVQQRRGLDALEALAPDWQRLWQQRTNEVWMSYAWRRLWWEHFGAGKHLRVFALTAAGEEATPLAVFDLFASRRGGFRRLEPLGHASQRWRPVSAGPSLPALIAPWADQLARIRDWDVLALESLEKDAADAIAAAFAARGLSIAAGLVRYQRYIPLQRPLAAVLADIRPHLRAPQRERSLRRQGAVQLQVFGSRDAVERYFDECLRVEASGWKGRTGTALLHDPACASFYRQLALRLADAGQLLFTLLCQNERILAFQISAVADGVVSGLKMGFDDAFRRFGPGIILLLHLVHLAHERGCREIDLLGEDDGYKADWTPHKRAIQSLRIYNRTARGRVLWLRHRLRRPPPTPAAHVAGAIG